MASPSTVQWQNGRSALDNGRMLAFAHAEDEFQDHTIITIMHVLQTAGKSLYSNKQQHDDLYAFAFSFVFQKQLHKRAAHELRSHLTNDITEYARTKKYGRFSAMRVDNESSDDEEEGAVPSRELEMVKPIRFKTKYSERLAAEYSDGDFDDFTVNTIIKQVYGMKDMYSTQQQLDDILRYTFRAVELQGLYEDKKALPLKLRAIITQYARSKKYGKSQVVPPASSDDEAEPGKHDSQMPVPSAPEEEQDEPRFRQARNAQLRQIARNYVAATLCTYKNIEIGDLYCISGWCDEILKDVGGEGISIKAMQVELDKKMMKFAQLVDEKEQLKLPITVAKNAVRDCKRTLVLLETLKRDDNAQWIELNFAAQVKLHVAEDKVEELLRLEAR